MRRTIGAFILILILGLAALLFIPAVMRVREAANCINCQGNLRQLGMTVQCYRDTNVCFPRAIRPNPRLPPEKCFSWLVEICPYIDGSNLLGKMESEKSWDAEENRYIALTQNWLFQCPSYPSRPPESTLVPLPYLGITGLGEDSADLPRDDPRAGLFGYRRVVSLQDVKDGTAETMMLAETAWAHGAWPAGGPATVRFLDPKNPPYLGHDGKLGGNHPNKTNIVFADGSVRSIMDTIEPKIIEALSTIAGGEKTGPVGSK